jgi:uncharacterized protein (TIGR00297 family)
LGRWLVSALLGASVAGLAYWRRTLTADGALAAMLVGAVTFARGGLPSAGALLAFFVSSSALSRVALERKRSLPLAQSKGAQRDVWQVLANGGAATFWAAVDRPQATVGALAAAAADTWATELGMLARHAPRLITTWRTVEPGTSGGVTLEGLVASLCGAMTVGFAAEALGGGRGLVLRAVFAGLIGSVLDSLTGATLQASYFCARCGKATEESRHAACGSKTELVRGASFVTNDVVNAFATVCGSLVALL